MARGKFKHATILESPALDREGPIGIAVHYGIGVLLCLSYLGTLNALEIAPTWLNAIAFGLATTILPWFYLYPAWGYGVLGRDAGGSKMALFSLFNHAFFGLGLSLGMAIFPIG